jgi:hypothetical protein
MDIEEVCRLLGTTSRTLRYYEEKGIIQSTAVFPGRCRHYTPEQLADIIKTVILDDFNAMSILSSDDKWLISIQGYFQVALYEPPENLISFIKLLCQAEGLFLKYKAEDGSRRLI